VAAGVADKYLEEVPPVAVEHKARPRGNTPLQALEAVGQVEQMLDDEVALVEVLYTAAAVVVGMDHSEVEDVVDRNAE
jgi:hypothetical protein